MGVLVHDALGRYLIISTTETYSMLRVIKLLSFSHRSISSLDGPREVVSKLLEDVLLF
jgi:hypothetical protein